MKQHISLTIVKVANGISKNCALRMHFISELATRRSENPFSEIVFAEVHERRNQIGARATKVSPPSYISCNVLN